MIFVDTCAWFATTIPTDADYPLASRWFTRNRESLVTTDYILDETMTLLKTRGQYSRALTLGAQLFSGEIAHIHYLAAGDIAAAWQIFQRYSDKEWSFTDCTSKVVMDRLGITTAFTFDHHFRQFGGITVVP